MNHRETRSGWRAVTATAALGLWAASALAIAPAAPLTDASLRSWMATIWDKSANKLVCGASIIDPHWLLTASHCVCIGQVPRGALEAHIPARPTFPVTHVKCPPASRNAGLRNDIALVEIQDVFDIRLPALGQRPITPPGDVPLPSRPLLSVGWSSGNHEEPPYSSPQTLRLTPLPRKRCLELLSQSTCPEHRSLGPTQFCAWAPGAAPTSFYGLQKGDSGGPLGLRMSGVPVVVGVASQACSTGLAIFEDVSRYRSWIAGEACSYYKPWPKRLADCRQRLEK